MKDMRGRAEHQAEFHVEIHRLMVPPVLEHKFPTHRTHHEEHCHQDDHTERQVRNIEPQCLWIAPIHSKHLVASSSRRWAVANLRSATRLPKPKHTI
jgi:hypothetical protein